MIANRWTVQTLTCEGQAMLDPLSLADCRGISLGGLNLIQVQVILSKRAVLQPLHVHVCNVSDNAAALPAYWCCR